MLVSLIEIGDSLGVRIPTAMLQQLGAAQSVELLAEEGRLVIQPAQTSRRQWEEALASMIEWIDAAPTGEVPDLPRHQR